MKKKRREALRAAAMQLGLTISAGGVATMVTNIAEGDASLALAGAALCLIGSAAIYLGGVTTPEEEEDDDHD